MPQSLDDARPLALLFRLYLSIHIHAFMFVFKQLLHFILNIVGRRYTGLSANDIRGMNVSASMTALRNAVSSITERPAVGSGRQPNYATTILLQSEVCGQLDFQQLKDTPDSTLTTTDDPPCSVFILPQKAGPHENETLARFRAIMARDATCVDPRSGRAWRVPVDAATALSKANQLGFVAVSSCAGNNNNNNVNTWTLSCVVGNESKPSATAIARSQSAPPVENGAHSLIVSQRNDERRGSAPGALSVPESGADSRVWQLWSMLRNVAREIEDNATNQPRNDNKASKIRRLLFPYESAARDVQNLILGGFNVVQVPDDATAKKVQIVIFGGFNWVRVSAESSTTDEWRK